MGSSSILRSDPTRNTNDQQDFHLSPHEEKWCNSPCGPRPTVPNSVYATLGPEVHEQMFQSGGQSAKPPVLSSQARLVIIYRPTEGMKD
ncbi:hypothetical protein TNCV_2221901 [Trichonephila clavipes]|nr:hypothetical protein TNCV_2221901 [Trichonephila clavipes]